MNDIIPIGNYLLELYFGSFHMPDSEEHLYYKLSFMTADRVPIANTMLTEWGFDMLLDNMEYLPENCGFGFDFQPSEPMVNYSLWVGYETDTEDADVQNIFTTDQNNRYTEQANVRIALYKQIFGHNETPLFDTYITFEDYYKLWKRMSGCWWSV